MRLWGAGLVVALIAVGVSGAPMAQGVPGPGEVERPSPQPVWHVSGEGRGRPAVDESHVYFLSKRHEVLAVEAASGRMRWKQTTGEPGGITFGMGVVLSGEVVAAADIDIIAFDRRSGAMRWRFVPADGYGTGPYMGVAAEGLIFTGSATGRLHAIDDRTGRARWTAVVSDDDRTTVFGPEVDGDLVAAGYTTWVAPNIGGIVALDARSGRERWRTPFPRPSDPTLGTNWGGGPLIVGDLVIASSGDGVIYAFRRDTGAIAWSIPRLDGPLDGTFVSPDRDFRPLARSGRTLLAGSLTGYTVAYDLDTRQERWRYSPRLNASVAFALTADDRVVYVPHFAGTIVVIDLADGHEVRRIGNWQRGFNWPVAVSGDRFYAAASDEGFFAFDRRALLEGVDR
jgi:glucose dehydrogenase